MHVPRRKRLRANPVRGTTNPDPAAPNTVAATTDPLPLVTEYTYLGAQLSSGRMEAQWDKSQQSARKLVRSFAFSTAPLIADNWMRKQHAISLASSASHGALLYGSAALGNVSLMADVAADRALGHGLAWNACGFRGSSNQPRLHRSCMISLGIAPTHSLHVRARITMLWGIL